MTGRLGESLEDGPHSGHLTGEILSSSPVFQFQTFWMWNVLGRSMFECLIPRAAKSRCGVTEQDSGFVAELISWKMGSSWECRSPGGGRVLEESLLSLVLLPPSPLPFPCPPWDKWLSTPAWSLQWPHNLSQPRSNRARQPGLKPLDPWVKTCCFSLNLFISDVSVTMAEADPVPYPVSSCFWSLLSIIGDRNSGAPWILPTDQRTQRTLQRLHMWVASGSERMQSSEDTENNKGCQ